MSILYLALGIFLFLLMGAFSLLCHKIKVE